LKEAELASQLLPRSKVEEAVGPVFPYKDSTGSCEKHEGYDACGHGACRARRRERDSAPNCRGQPTVDPKRQSKLQVTITRKDEGDDLPREVGARTADCTGADEPVDGEGLDAAGLSAMGLVEGDDEEPALGGPDQLRALAMYSG
jgi:hypothetical protein